jgi:acetylornithine deacetylase/succinyl-diaminopimelate desuccinylase-like protein
MNFDPETALDYARALARPRRVGSGADEAVAQEIAQRLERCGWTVQRQPFRVSARVNAAIAVQIVAALLLIAAALWSGAVPAWIPAVGILILLMTADRIIRAAQARSVVPGVGERQPARNSPGIATANLIAAPPHSPNTPTAPRLYLAAHYDSKSQFMPIVVRVALFAAAIGGAVAFAALTLAGMLLPALTPAAIVAGIFTMIIAAPLALLQVVEVGNASPGAIDNASGVGAVLHLAECLAARPDLLTRLRVTLLFTSAEELGLLGAAAYVRQNETELRRQAASSAQYVLNLDSVGIEGALHYTDAPARSSGRLVKLLREACGELGIPVKRFSLPGALFDHMPFARLGLDAVSLTVVGRASRAIHTRGDAADKLQARGFELAGRVALRVMERLGGQGTEGKVLPAK